MSSYRKDMTPQERERYNAERRAKYAEKHLQSDLAKKVAAGWAKRRDPQTKLEEAKHQALADFQRYKREQERKEQEKAKRQENAPKREQVWRPMKSSQDEWRRRKEIAQQEQLLERLKMQEEKTDTISGRNAIRFKIYQVRKKIALLRNTRKSFKDLNEEYDTNFSYDDNQNRY